MKVFKFGGTSVGSPERIKNVSKLVSNNEPKIVVLSAMSGTTNNLVEIADYYYKKNDAAAFDRISELENKYKKVIDELLVTKEYKEKAGEYTKSVFSHLRSFRGKDFTSTQEKDILAQGELLSTHLFTYFNHESNIDTVLLPALDYMKVDENGEPILAEIEKDLNKMLAVYPGKKLFVTQGFICRNPKGQIDNLKRGGSDYSATLIGAAIESSEVQIWTDIDGVHNNDPRIVNNTFPIAQMSFDEAAELAYFGAKILHPATVLPAKLKNIPVLLKNTMDPRAAGTTISNEVIGSGIKAIAAKDNITVVNIKSSRMLMAYGFLRKVFEIFENYRTPIDMITTSEVALSITIDNSKFLSEILGELRELGTVTITENQTIVCVVGNMSVENQGYAADILAALHEIPVSMISYGGSPYNISLLIEAKDKNKALNLLNDKLFTSKK